MDTDAKNTQPTHEPPSPETNDQQPALSEEEAKKRALRKRKPFGPVVKPLTKEQIEALLGDPEVKERENLSDALPKGYDTDYQDEF
jgi:hypothetical protein